MQKKIDLEQVTKSSKSLEWVIYGNISKESASTNF